MQAFEGSRVGFVLALLFIVTHPTNCTAQQQNSIGGIISGFLQAANAEKARQDWDRLPQLERACIANAAARTGSSLNRLANAGVGPTHASVDSLRAACDDMLNRKFKTEYECTIQVGGVKYLTRCDEAYGKIGPSKIVERVPIEQVIIDPFQKSYIVAEFERFDAKTRREQMQHADASETKVPAPTWSCDTVKSKSGSAICESYELTLLDNLYSVYGDRAEKTTQSKQAKTKIQLTDRRSAACESNKSCIKQSLISGIDELALLLKLGGLDLPSYTQQQQEKARRVAEIEAQKASEMRARLEQSRADELAAKLRAEKALLEQKQLEQDANLRAENVLQDQKRSAQDAKAKEEKMNRYLDWVRQIAQLYITGRSTSDIAFPAPMKEEISSDEVKEFGLQRGPVQDQDGVLDAYRVINDTTSDLTKRSSIFHLAAYESKIGRSAEGVALVWFGLRDSKASSTAAYGAYKYLMKQWISSGFVQKKDVCSVVIEAIHETAKKPFRRREIKTVAAIAHSVDVGEGLNCMEDETPQSLMKLQVELCSINLPTNEVLVSSYDTLKGSCWASPAGFVRLKELTSSSFGRLIIQEYEKQKLELAVSANSAERRSHQERFEKCRQSLADYTKLELSKTVAAIAAIERACLEFQLAKG